mmetsp:Transcript_2982/g.7623  ORF Transcript_2982/g.7623 Transcript_2982/m.7623 type:complete len:475 (+) Transcript_2982:45-1469(+)
MANKQTSAGGTGPSLQQNQIDWWGRHANGDLEHVSDATGFLLFDLHYNEALQRCTVTPEHYVITFSKADAKAKQKLYTSLLCMQIVEAAPEGVKTPMPVARSGDDSISGDFIEFQLLSRSNDASCQPTLKITAGPVRTNPETQQREFMRIDLGKCAGELVNDVIDDVHHRGQKLTRTRWWIPIRLLRLICDTNQLDCSGLDDQASPPLEWVMSLVDDRGASDGSEPLDKGEQSIDEIAKFIDGANGDKKAKAKRKKKKNGADPVLEADPEEEPPPLENPPVESLDSSLPRATEAARKAQDAVQFLEEAAQCCSTKDLPVMEAAIEAARKAARAAAAHLDALKRGATREVPTGRAGAVQSSSSLLAKQIGQHGHRTHSDIPDNERRGLQASKKAPAAAKLPAGASDAFEGVEKLRACAEMLKSFGEIPQHVDDGLSQGLPAGANLQTALYNLMEQLQAGPPAGFNGQQQNPSPQR